MEILERPYNPMTGHELESPINHIGDILAFFIGSLLAYQFVMSFALEHTWLRVIVLAIIVLTAVQEIGRELWPYTWPRDPAYA